MRRRLQILVFIFPAMAFLVLFWLGPIAATVGISLTDWDYMTPDFRVVGLENYRNLLGDEAFAAALRQTLMFALETVIPGVALGLALAALVTAAGQNMRPFCLPRGSPPRWQCPLSGPGFLSRTGDSPTRCSDGWGEAGATG